MKKSLLFLIVLMVLAFTAKAQLQLLNPGFENWEATGSQAKPNNWSSFPQSDGSWAWAARTAQHYHRNGGRPGTSGSSYVTIYSRSVMGVVANGNITTGQVHAGSTSASSSDNYNYTHRGSYAHAFSGTPDSMYVWVSYYAASASSQASISAYIHGNSDFRDPNDKNTTSLYCGKSVATFTRTTSSNSSYSWQQIRAPFVYDGTASANYILMSLTTNATPGSGSANDSLSIDDIEFVYSAWLDAIAINGTAIADFQRDSFDYSLSLPTANALSQAVLTYTTQAADASVLTDTAWQSPYEVTYTLYVTAEDSATTRTYSVTLSAPEPVCNPATDLQASVDGNSVILSWTPGEGNIAWEVEYGLEGFALGSGTLANSNATALALNNLDYDNTYEAYLRANCADSLYTDWSEPISFTTSTPVVIDCESPEQLVPEAITLNSCTVSWQALTETLHEVMLLHNTDTLLVDTTQSGSYTFTQLQPNTTYIAKVRARCDSANVGSWTTATFATLEPEGINSVASSFRLYPNPASTHILIDSPHPVTSVIIYDLAGRIVLSALQPTRSISIANLPNGAYTLAATLADGTIATSRLVKQ